MSTAFELGKLAASTVDPIYTNGITEEPPGAETASAAPGVDTNGNEAAALGALAAVRPRQLG